MERQVAAVTGLDPGLRVDVHFVDGKTTSWAYVRENPRVAARLAGGGYDLLHVHYGLTALACLLRPRRVPWIVSVYGSDVNLGWQRAIVRSLSRSAAARIAVSETLARRLGAPCEVIPVGVDLASVRPEPAASARRRLGLDPDRRYVLFGADPARSVKGYPLFRETVALLRARDPRVDELVLWEPGQPHERVVAKMNAADLLLFTSLPGSEGAPVVIREALAVNLPIVSVDVGDARSLLAGVGACALGPWNAEALAELCLQTLARGGRSDGRERREREIDARESDRRIVELYHRVARRRPEEPRA